MPIPTFGVTDSDIRGHYFPQLAAFSSSTTPTDSYVDAMIDAEAATLAGRLSAKGMAASTFDDDAGDSYPIAYEWCRETIRQGAAVRVAWAMAGNEGNAAAWAETLRQRYEDLDKYGPSVLGDAPVDSEDTNGPRWHVGDHGLDTGLEADISDAIPRFRRDDML